VLEKIEKRFLGVLNIHTMRGLPIYDQLHSLENNFKNRMALFYLPKCEGIIRFCFFKKNAKTIKFCII
jgi:hypothetical protein